ncbi:MAG: galactokinase [Planctomycetes bacterium]|nr:galactokinase [Planctomycetota bacterium]
MHLLERLFSSLPAATHGAFAPGRVNLIGEHTDYSGLPVLPFAIEQGLAIVAAPRRDELLRIEHLDPKEFAPEELPLRELATRSRRGAWTDYVIAGLRLHPPPIPMTLRVDGDLPVAAGLSSSSALVCASAMLFAPLDVDRRDLAERARVGEQYVGTLSGGMDQAASLLGQQGQALRIDFRPVRATLVPVPAELTIAVADSGVRAAKGGAAQAAYNERVTQCRAAARQLGAPGEGLLADVPGTERAAAARRLADPLLARRAGFVFEEAERVVAAVTCLQRGDLPALGQLLDASHAGLTEDYEVGHPAVDRLVRVARAAGAFGARIVGAGFGGCCIALTTPTAAAGLVATLQHAGATQAFVARPAAGAFAQRR